MKAGVVMVTMRWPISTMYINSTWENTQKNVQNHRKIAVSVLGESSNSPKLNKASNTLHGLGSK